MSELNMRLGALPSVDELVKRPELSPHVASVGHQVTVDVARDVIARARTRLLAGDDVAVDATTLAADAVARLDALARHGVRRVVNATGVLLHTNLGRAPLSTSAAERIAAIVSHYNTLEYDLNTGARGHRGTRVTRLLRTLVGAESAIVVNNNAAAVFLVLSALMSGREVVVSRGELVEIGGAFRIPDVMRSAGATLIDVGTTNKTHLYDYERALSSETGCLMKVHTSNYRIVGFHESVSLSDMATLAHSKNLPVIYDLGSGLMLDVTPYGITDEPTVAAGLKQGADVVCFSADKLLGGPQAGVIVGRADLLAQVRRHPLMRALRVGKLTLAALEATLECYLDERDARHHIPIVSMLALTPETLDARAKRLQQTLAAHAIDVEIVTSEAVMGGGTTPMKTFPSRALRLHTPPNVTPDGVAARLRTAPIPLIGRIDNDTLLFDVRTLRDDDDAPFVDALVLALGARS